MPRDTAVAATAGEGAGSDAPAAGGTPSSAADTRPGGGLGVPLDPEGTNDPWAKYKWWILGGLGLAMAVGAGIMLKNGPQQALVPAVAVVGAAASGDSLLTAMKEELFALETDRLQGRLTENEYVEQKAALEVVLRRALMRGEQVIATSNVAGPVA